VNYHVTWSDKDKEWVATCDQYPSCSYHAPGAVHALAGLTSLIRAFRKEAQTS
jgi:hypothetical protein